MRGKPETEIQTEEKSIEITKRKIYICRKKQRIIGDLRLIQYKNNWISILKNLLDNATTQPYILRTTRKPMAWRLVP